MSPRLILGIPSKGRLQSQTEAYLEDAGLGLRRDAGARDYRGGIAGMPNVEVLLLSAGEIALALMSGEVHLGITGEDLIRETMSDHARRIVLIAPLGFGRADVVVAVPKAWIDVSTMADLDDVCAAYHARHGRRLRIATKYVALTRAFFARHGIADYRIVESLGATEGAPAAGVAEAIVDITSTGTTLAANALKVVDDGRILASEAQLAASLGADWNPDARAAAEPLLRRLAAREHAKRAHVVRVRLGQDADAVLQALANAIGAHALSMPAAGNRAGEYAISCPRLRLMEAVALLRARGAEGPITVHDADYVFEDGNPFLARLEAALKG